MAVYQKRGPAARMLPCGVDDRMATGGDNSDLFQSDTPEMSRQPGGALAQVTGMFGLVADAGKTDELFQFSEEARAMPASVGKSTKGFHDAWCLGWVGCRFEKALPRGLKPAFI